MPRRHARRALAGAALLLGAASLAGAQRPPRGAPGASWVVASSASVDLWYHGLALIGADGPGALAYYSGDYATVVRADKRARGIAPSALERTARALRSALARDSAMEIVHFLPLYLPANDPEAMLDALNQVAEAAPRTADPRLAPGIAALRAALATPAQRALLARLVAAMRDEWRSYLREARERDAAALGVRLASLQRSWDALFAPALEPYFEAMSLDGGVVLVSPALGAEGRIVTRRGRGTVIVVGLAGDGASRAPLFRAVREACFPLVERVSARLPAIVRLPRIAAADASGRAAVRCGALLLAARPALADEYRALFLGAAADEPGRSSAERFEERFSIDPEVDAGLKAEIGRLGARVSSMRH